MTRPLTSLLVLMLSFTGLACKAAAPDYSDPPVDRYRAVEEPEYAEFLSTRGAYLQCNDRLVTEAPGGHKTLSRVTGTTASLQAFRQGAPCSYQIRLVDPSAEGEVSPVDSVPVPIATYTGGLAIRTARHTVIALARVDATFSEELNRYGAHEAYDVRNYQILVTRRDDETGAWDRPQVIVTHDTYAVWLSGLYATDDGAHHVRYMLDGLHERMFLSPVGRLSDEGVYETAFRYTPDLTTEPSRQVGTYAATDLFDLDALAPPVP